LRACCARANANAATHPAPAAMEMETGSVVLPGDVIKVADGSTHLKLGPGLGTLVHDGPVAAQPADTVTPIATKCGVLEEKFTKAESSASFYVVSDQKRYVPVVGDMILGTITGKPAESFTVDIGTARNANLSMLAFEGATKRNRPDVQVGDTVYCRVAFANKFVEPEVTCVNSHGKSGGLGKLVDGYIAKCTLGTCRRLLSPKYPVLEALGNYVKYEIAVGSNGLVWMKSDSVADTLLVAQAIEASQKMSADLTHRFVKELVQSRA